MGHCRTRQSRRFATVFQRGHSQAGGSRAGSGNGTRSEHSPEEGGHRGGPSSRQISSLRSRRRILESILTTVRRVREGLSLTVKQFQILLGLMAAASNVIPFGLLYMRPLQWWLKTKGFSLRGNPLRTIKVTRRCLRALDMWRKPWFLSQGPVLGAPCHRITLATDASLTSWGAVMSGHPACGLWNGHHLKWHINCLEMLAMFRALKHFLPDLRKSPCVGMHRQHSSGFLYQPPGRSAFAPLIQAGTPDPWVVPGQVPLAENSLYSWASQYRSILSRQGPRPREWRLHSEVVKQIWRVFGQAQVDLFATR